MIGKVVKIIAFAMVVSGATGMQIYTQVLICFSLDIDKYLSIFDYCCDCSNGIFHEE